MLLLWFRYSTDQGCFRNARCYWMPACCRYSALRTGYIAGHADVEALILRYFFLSSHCFFFFFRRSFSFDTDEAAHKGPNQAHITMTQTKALDCVRDCVPCALLRQHNGSPTNPSVHIKFCFCSLPLCISYSLELISGDCRSFGGPFCHLRII